MITHREAFALNAMTSEGGCLTVTPALHKKDGASWESMIAAGYVQRRALGVNVVMMPGDSLRITEAGIDALQAFKAAERAAYERRKADYARLTAAKPAPTDPATPALPPATPAKITADVMAETGCEPAAYRAHGERPSIPGGIKGAPNVREEAAFDAAMIEFARAARRRGIDVETDGRMDKVKVEREVNRLLRGVASDRPGMTTERLCEALGKLTDTPATTSETPATASQEASR